MGFFTKKRETELFKSTPVEVITKNLVLAEIDKYEETLANADHFDRVFHNAKRHIEKMEDGVVRSYGENGWTVGSFSIYTIRTCLQDYLQNTVLMSAVKRSGELDLFMEFYQSVNEETVRFGFLTEKQIKADYKHTERLIRLGD